MFNLSSGSRVLSFAAGRNAVFASVRPAEVRRIGEAKTVRDRRDPCVGIPQPPLRFEHDAPIFSADAHYIVNFPRQEGLMHLGQSSVYLPLLAGKNDVTFIVTDRFGGMGLIVRDPGVVR